MSKDTIKFPCVVNIKGFTEDQVIELASAFVKLGATDDENTDTHNYNSWKYYGVNWRDKTAFEDYLSDYACNEENEVTEYTYNEVMAFVNSTEEGEVAQHATPYEYKVGDTVRVLREHHDHSIEIGSEVKILKITEDTPKYKTDADGWACWVCDDEIELVSSASASSETDIATLEPIEYEGSSSGETLPNQSVGASVESTKQVFNLGDEVEVVEDNFWVGTGMKGTIVHIDQKDIDLDKEPYQINFNGKTLWTNGYQLKLVNSATGSAVPEEVCATAINITANVSFTVKIKGQEFILNKEEMKELYDAICVAEGELGDFLNG